MKKILVPLMVIAIILIIIAIPMFMKNSPNEDITINIGSLKGPTSISLLKLMEDNEKKNALNEYNFTVTGAADEITVRLAKNELDIAILPCNLAAILYNKQSIDISILAINNLNVLYVLENGNSINSISDLEGKTIYMTGKGTVPEYTIKFLLTKAGIENKVKIEYKTEASEVAALLNSGKANIAILPEPYVTTAKNQNPNLRIALDIGTQWNKIQAGEIVTAVAIVRQEFLDNNRKKVDDFLREYKESIEYVNNNNEETAKLAEKFNIIPIAVAKEAIYRCNIEYIDGTKMKEMVSRYLGILYNMNPQSIGGQIPDVEIYYEKQ